MRERAETPREIPLFDPMPEGLEEQEGRIRETYDGTFDHFGITMVLAPRSGELIRAKVVDLMDGKFTNYEHLARGKWSSATDSIRPGSTQFNKMDAIYEAVRKKLDDWKDANPHYPHLREWTSEQMGKPEKPFVPGQIPVRKKRVRVIPARSEEQSSRINERDLFVSPTPKLRKVKGADHAPDPRPHYTGPAIQLPFKPAERIGEPEEPASEETKVVFDKMITDLFKDLKITGIKPPTTHQKPPTSRR